MNNWWLSSLEALSLMYCEWWPSLRFSWGEIESLGTKPRKVLNSDFLHSHLYIFWPLFFFFFLQIYGMFVWALSLLFSFSFLSLPPPSPRPKEAWYSGYQLWFFNSSSVHTREESIMPKHLKKLCHGCLIHLVHNGSCASLLAMELEKLLMNGKITVSF